LKNDILRYCLGEATMIELGAEDKIYPVVKLAIILDALMAEGVARTV
jgi:hypothetical protein